MKLLDKIEKVEWLKTIIVAILIILFLQWLVWPMRVNGRSMENTLHHLDFLIVSKAITFIEPVKNGDLLVLDVEVKDYSERVVKRVIGISGDHIVIKDGRVYVNGEMITEDYIQGMTFGSVDVMVGHNHVFVLGDNRPVSKDSRSFGCIPLDGIIGKVVYKISTTH
jgi:signal peptidase I